MTSKAEVMENLVMQGLLTRAGVPLSHPEEELREAVRPQGRMVDNGIGSYEYWGSRGRHVQMDFECEDSGLEKVEWCQEEAPVLGEFGTVEFKTTAHAGEDDGGYGGYEVTVRAHLKAFSTKVETVKAEGRRLRYWRCEATYDWRVL